MESLLEVAFSQRLLKVKPHHDFFMPHRRHKGPLELFDAIGVMPTWVLEDFFPDYPDPPVAVKFLAELIYKLGMLCGYASLGFQDSSLLSSLSELEQLG